VQPPQKADVFRGGPIGLSGCALHFEEKSEKYWAEVADKHKTRVTKWSDGQPIGKGTTSLNSRRATRDRPILSLARLLNGTLSPSSPIFLTVGSARYGFVPRTPASEIDFKKPYAARATAAGITKPQAV
jgi:hypothetical protein